MTENEIAAVVVDAAVRIHRALGPGLLESVYQSVLAIELRKAGLTVQTEVAVPVQWDDHCVEVGFRADLLVNDRVIVELKSVEKVAAAHKKQVLTYLRLADKRLGLLLNFGVELMRDGISRIANGLEE